MSDIHVSRNILEKVGSWQSAASYRARLERQLVVAKLNEQQASRDLCLTVIPESPETNQEIIVPIGDGDLRITIKPRMGEEYQATTDWITKPSTISAAVLGLRF